MTSTTLLEYAFWNRWMDRRLFDDLGKAMGYARLHLHNQSNLNGGEGFWRFYQICTVKEWPCEDRFNPYLKELPIKLPGGAVLGLVSLSTYYPSDKQPPSSPFGEMVIGLVEPFKGFPIPDNLNNRCLEAVSSHPETELWSCGKGGETSSDLFSAYNQNLHLRGRGAGMVKTQYTPRYPMGFLGYVEMPVEYFSGWWPETSSILVMNHPDGWKFFQYGISGGFNEIKASEVPWDTLAQER